MKTYIELSGLKFPVETVDSRWMFGRKEVLVIPLNGSGQRWIWEARLLKSDPDLKKKIKSNI